jgi:hypothetical protein
VRCLLLIALLTLAPAAAAQWEAEPDPGRDGRLQAMVSNPEGDRLTVVRRDDDQVVGTFTLGRGFDRLREGSCPSFAVDEAPPVALGRAASPCATEGDQASFTLGRVDEDTLVSPLVLQLMNGRELTLRYPLQARGYRETRFVLRGSKQALSDALGAGVDVRGETP